MVRKGTKTKQCMELLSVCETIDTNTIYEVCGRVGCHVQTGWRALRRLRQEEEKKQIKIDKYNSIMRELIFFRELFLSILKKFKTHKIQFVLTPEEKTRIQVIDKMITKWEELNKNE